MLPSLLSCSTVLSVTDHAADTFLPKLSVAETERRSPTSIVIAVGVTSIPLGGGPGGGELALRVTPTLDESAFPAASVACTIMVLKPDATLTLQVNAPELTVAGTPLHDTV